jgi:dipeptidyl aminopeptidase/acylaminoacyl peptidase
VDANHTASFSPDLKYYVDTYSRVDAAPMSELRRTSDRSLVMELEKADITALVKAGWAPPEVFTAKGRDGQTDIWGVIYRPSGFDPAKKYPVIENIYAGPHSSFVPKSFAGFNQMLAQAELGFIVVQIDGMGTSNRSKAFHDVAWKNIKDAGFPDRILWHKAVVAKYPYYDITRVGIYGTSAGGQNSLGALLFHPDFYKVAVSFAGCHDNRMDKIWWNEQWMGWPIGPQYAESSNVDNAYRLQGRVLLVVGEMDHNVDPSSTMQVVNQLIKHNKDFDLLVLPGMGHGSGGAYGDHKRYDFFVRHLLGANPPSWAAVEEAVKPQAKSTAPSAGR